MRDFQLPGRSNAYAMNGMCATSHPLAARTAVRILEDGGNAVDAAIAAAVLLGLCEPQSTGIGGDCFVLLKPPGEERIIALNGSGKAPAGFSAEALREAGHDCVPIGGAVPVTVPGAVDAFCTLVEDWGRLGLEACLAPAIEYAENGVPVAPRVAFDWAIAADSLTGAARNFYLNDGRAFRPGEVFRAPGQAEVLRRIVREGRRGFYEGEVAQDMVDSLRAAGGTHTEEDFSNCACNYTDPIAGTYKGLEVVEHPPNGQGAAAILLLNMLEQFDLPSVGPFGAERAHFEAEAAKLALDARDRYIADPGASAKLSFFLSKSKAKELAAKVYRREVRSDLAVVAEAVHKDTVLLTVVDKDRMAVSLIYSVFHSFGSGMASEKFGINFHNRGAGFNLIEGHPNEAGPGKRPMHTILPAMLKRNGKVVMPFGVMGGQYQAVGHARLITNIADYGMNLQAALDGPRCFPENGSLLVERGYSEKVRDLLRSYGHDVVDPEHPIGGGQAIHIDYGSGVLVGASDCRKDGCALGY